MKDFWTMLFYIFVIVGIPAIIIAGGVWFFRIIWESDLPMWLKFILLK